MIFTEAYNKIADQTEHLLSVTSVIDNSSTENSHYFSC